MCRGATKDSPEGPHLASLCLIERLPESVLGGSGLKLKQEMLLWSEGRNIGISFRGAAHSSRCEVL